MSVSSSPVKSSAHMPTLIVLVCLGVALAIILVAVGMGQPVETMYGDDPAAVIERAQYYAAAGGALTLSLVAGVGAIVLSGVEHALRR